jgi:hypothetical protein
MGGVFAVGLASQNWLIALGGGILAAAALFTLTLETGTGTLAERMMRGIRWAYRGRRGIRAYQPWDWAAWNEHLAGHKALTKADVRAMRYRPDSADGMGWLVSDPRVPGIAWHEPRAQEQYLSVTWQVEGRLRGLESDEAMDAGAAAWGRFLASMGGLTALPKYVQTMTRVLPPDLAWHDEWVDRMMDKDAPAILIQSYLELLAACERGSLVQRHFVTVRWPLTEEFTRQASYFGAGQDGWRELMGHEIEAMTRALEIAGVGDVSVLTARQTVAVMLHVQDPDRPIEKVADVDPEVMGLPSRDTRKACVITTDTGEWWHSTGMMRGESLSTGHRHSFWLHSLLIGMRQPIVRSISFHLRVIPAAEAQRSADRDAYGTETEIVSAQQRGRLVPRDMINARELAEQKRIDLEPGSMNHGVRWVGYITVSARTRAELTLAKRLVEEQAQNGLGLSRIAWQDAGQAAALGGTMPLARGLKDAGVSRAGKVLATMGRMSTDGAEED